MPIKSLEAYLFERKLVNTSSIEILQNATIGIDVEHYLSRIYTFKKEQFLSAIGGIPSSLKDYIQSDLQVFKEFNIKPIFVMSGLSIQLQAPNYATNELSQNEQHLENTWSRISAKMSNPYAYGSMSNESFRLFTDPLPLRPMINDLIKYFVEIGIDYMVCPYDASFQLSYLYQNKSIDTIYGSTDLLLTEVDKFILGMEFQSKDFRFIDKFKVLHELGLVERQLIDISLMVGCNLQPQSFPNLPPLPKPSPSQPYPQLSYFKLALDILYQYLSISGNNGSDLYGYVCSLNDPRCLELYQKGHIAVRYVPILNDEGYVTLYYEEMAKKDLIGSGDEFLKVSDPSEEASVADANGKDGSSPEGTQKVVKVPNDLHEIISQRLPAEFYFYQAIGMAPIELLEAITHGVFLIRPPSESGLNDTYTKLINSKFYADNLDTLFNLLTAMLARYYQVKRIKVDYWYRNEPLELNNRMVPPTFQKIKHLVFSSPGAKPEFSLMKFFKALQEGYSPGAEFTGELTTTNEIISTALLRAFYLFGIIDSKTNKLSSEGRIIYKFASKFEAKLSPATLQQLVLVLLLIKSNTVKLNESNREFTSVARNFKELSSEEEINLEPAEFKHITLLSRIFSFHKFNISPINYQGPISRSLLNFRSHVKFISTNLTFTLQSCLVDLVVRQQYNNIKVEYQSKDQWYKLIDQLPFYRDINNTLMGVIAEIYFEYSCKQTKLNKDLDNEQIVSNTRDHLLNTVFQINNSTFNINVNGVNSVTSKQLLSDIKDAVAFWELFVEFAKTINEEDSSIIGDQYLLDIQETDKWMKKFV